MTCRKFPNYLRTYRRRTRLSQRDIAYLLGGYDAARVSRHEHFIESPSLRASLGYAVIFNSTMREMFKGEYEKVEKEVRTRARCLAARLPSVKHDPFVEQKLTHLDSILSAPTKDRK